MPDAIIELTDVEKSFGKNTVLSGVSLRIMPSESFAIIGGSGVGKSVVMKCILGLMRPDKGRIAVYGQDVRENGEAFYSRIGMLFQEGALFDSMTVWQNVAFRLLRGRDRMSSDQARATAIEKLERVGLAAETADLFPSELSGGMKKRAGLARAIAADPDIIFFDEPTTGLDPIRASMINDLIRGIVLETHATAVTITHDMDSVRKISDRAALLHAGKVVWSGSSNKLTTECNPFVRQFVEGSSTGPMEVSI